MFITIDGPDGTGKTTLARGLVESLQAKGIPAVYTCEPTGSVLGQHIREILRKGGYELSRLTELFTEDRAQHIRDFIEPHCRQGEVVVCDRYKYSTVCYQHLQGEPVERLLSLNGGFMAPDLPVILCANDAGLLLRRIGQRGLGSDLFESRKTIEESIQLYQKMPDYFPEEHFFSIDAALPQQEAACLLLKEVLNRLSSGSEN